MDEYNPKEFRQDSEHATGEAAPAVATAGAPQRIGANAAVSSAGDAATRRMVNAPGIGGSVQANTRDSGSSDTQRMLREMHGMAGYALLSPDDQALLDHLIGGATNALSAYERRYFELHIEQMKSHSAEEQRDALKGLIGNRSALPDVTSEQQVGAQPIQVTLSSATEKPNFAFRSGAFDAVSYQATFSDGAAIEIVVPKAPDPNYHNYSAQQAADAARYLPQKNRALVKRIVLNPQPNPQDAHWAVQYNMAGFQSFMTADESGVVDIYPSKASERLQSDNVARGSMIHETGHTWSFRNWGTDKTKGKWKEWRVAMEADRTSVSGYAMSEIAEDVAETVAIYAGQKGTPAFNEYRAIVPNRFAMLDREMG